jgi:hypothetical protein
MVTIVNFFCFSRLGKKNLEILMRGMIDKEIDYNWRMMRVFLFSRFGLLDDWIYTNDTPQSYTQEDSYHHYYYHL